MGVIKQQTSVMRVQTMLMILRLIITPPGGEFCTFFVHCSLNGPVMYTIAVYWQMSISSAEMNASSPSKYYMIEPFAEK